MYIYIYTSIYSILFNDDFNPHNRWRDYSPNQKAVEGIIPLIHSPSLQSQREVVFYLSRWVNPNPPKNGVPAFHIAWHGCRYTIRILGSRWSAPPKKKTKNGSIPKPGQIVSFRWGNLEELMVFFGVESNIFLAIWYWSWRFWTTILRHQKWIQLQVESPRYCGWRKSCTSW